MSPENNKSNTNNASSKKVTVTNDEEKCSDRDFYKKKSFDIIGNDNILRVELEQITPILHFQGGECNASLKSTELKPKLDKFLCNRCEKNLENYVLPSKNDDNNHKAYDYQMVINALNKDEKITSQRSLIKLYGPIGPKHPSEYDDQKYALSFYKAIRITIISQHKQLLKVIEKNIEEFFAISNFGARQNKGFGHFKVKGMSNEELEEKVKKYYKLNMNEYGLYNMVLSDPNDIMECLRKIKKFHELLKNKVLLEHKNQGQKNEKQLMEGYLKGGKKLKEYT